MNRLTHTDSEYQHLSQHLFYNLNKDFRRYYKAIADSKNSENTQANAIACAELNLLTSDEMYDRKVTFITYELPKLIDMGMTKHSYQQNQSLVLNSYKNMMIDMWRKENTERKHVVHLEMIYTPDGQELNPMDNIAVEIVVDDSYIDQVWDAWASYVKTLSGEQKRLTFYWMPGNSKTLAEIGKDLNLPKTTVQYKVERLRNGFREHLIKLGIVRA